MEVNAMSNTKTIRSGACPVCGGREVEIDAVEQAVEQAGWLLLAECARCDHRWTQAFREPPAVVRAAVRVPLREVRPEVASAA
jgi:hypothetical protein